MTFSIDPTSTITAVPGAKNRGGFTMLPMAFTPELDVAIERPDQIRYAAQAINLMGQQSAVTLQPTITSLDEAAKRGVGLLAVASGEQLQRVGMRSPLLMSGARAVGVNGATVTDIDPGGTLGIVQTFSHNERVVLTIDSTGSAELADRTLDSIRGLDGGWSALAGDVVATGTSGKVVNLTMAAGSALEPPVHRGWHILTWASIALAAAALPAIAAIQLFRLRRARRRREDTPT
jgi:hypothetical protein